MSSRASSRSDRDGLPRGGRLGGVTQIVGDAASALLQRPAHAVVMVIGVMLGVASATATVAIADTQQAQIDRRFDLQRSHQVVLEADDLEAGGFPADQVERISRLEPVTHAGELSVWAYSAGVSRSYATTVVSSTVIAADVGGLAVGGAVSSSGSDLDLLPALGDAPVAWVGQGLADQLGLTPAASSTAEDGDSQIIVNGTPFSVAGAVRASGAFAYLDESVIISRAAAVAHVSPHGENVRFVAAVRPGSAGAVSRYALSVLSVGEGTALRDVTTPDGKLLRSSVAADLRRIGIALAAVIGVVGMLSAANTLAMSVYERRRELGLRSAMGWSRSRIAALLLVESTLAGLVAGVIGVAVGLAAAAVWSRAQHWDLIVAPDLAPVIILAGVLASLGGGIIPALKAASTSPLSAMRS